MFVLCVVIFVSCFSAAISYDALPTPYIYQTHWYHSMPIDHFAYTDNRTFSMRYLINDTFFKPGGPIFFYCGNEGAIDTFADNTVICLQLFFSSCVNVIRVVGSYVGYGTNVQCTPLVC